MAPRKKSPRSSEEEAATEFYRRYYHDTTPGGRHLEDQPSYGKDVYDKIRKLLADIELGEEKEHGTAADQITKAIQETLGISEEQQNPLIDMMIEDEVNRRKKLSGAPYDVEWDKSREEFKRGGPQKRPPAGGQPIQPPKPVPKPKPEVEERRAESEPNGDDLAQVIKVAEQAGANPSVIDWLWQKSKEYKQDHDRVRRNTKRDDAAAQLESKREFNRDRYSTARPQASIHHEGGNPLFEPDAWTRQGDSYAPGDRQVPDDGAEQAQAEPDGQVWLAANKTIPRTNPDEPYRKHPYEETPAWDIYKDKDYAQRFLEYHRANPNKKGGMLQNWLDFQQAFPHPLGEAPDWDPRDPPEPDWGNDETNDLIESLMTPEERKALEEYDKRTPDVARRPPATMKEKEERDEFNAGRWKFYENALKKWRQMGAPGAYKPERLNENQLKALEELQKKNGPRSMELEHTPYAPPKNEDDWYGAELQSPSPESGTVLASLGTPEARTPMQKRLPGTPEEWDHWEKNLHPEEQTKFDDLIIKQGIRGGEPDDQHQAQVDDLIVRTMPRWWKQQERDRTLPGWQKQRDLETEGLDRDLDKQRRDRTLGPTPEIPIEQPPSPWGNGAEIESQMRQRHQTAQLDDARAYLNQIAPPEEKAPVKAVSETESDPTEEILRDPDQARRYSEGLTERSVEPGRQDPSGAPAVPTTEGEMRDMMQRNLSPPAERRADYDKLFGEADQAFAAKFGRPMRPEERQIAYRHMQRYFEPDHEEPLQVRGKSKDPDFEQYDKATHEQERQTATDARFKELSPLGGHPGPENKLWEQAQKETDETYDRRFRNAFKYWENEYRHLKQTMQPEQAMDALEKRMHAANSSLNMIIAFDKWRQKNDEGEKLAPKDRRSELEEDGQVQLAAARSRSRPAQKSDGDFDPEKHDDRLAVGQRFFYRYLKQQQDPNWEEDHKDPAADDPVWKEAQQTVEGGFDRMFAHKPEYWQHQRDRLVTGGMPEAEADTEIKRRLDAAKPQPVKPSRRGKTADAQFDDGKVWQASSQKVDLLDEELDPEGHLQPRPSGAAAGTGAGRPSYMEPTLLDQHRIPDGAFLTDDDRLVDKDGNEFTQQRRPNVIPVTKNPDGSLSLAWPKIIDLFMQAGPVPGARVSGTALGSRFVRRPNLEMADQQQTSRLIKEFEETRKSSDRAKAVEAIKDVFGPKTKVEVDDILKDMLEFLKGDEMATAKSTGSIENKAANERWMKWYDQLSPEKKAEYRKAATEQQRARREGLSDEERAANNAREYERRDNDPRFELKRRNYDRARRENMTEAERAAVRARQRDWARKRAAER